MTPAVQAAIDEIKAAYVGHRIEVDEEPQGGAYVIVHDIDVGDRYTPSTTWIGSLITFQYPRAEVYPHFVDAALRRADGQLHSAGFSGPIEWHGRQALQVSRRSPRWDPTSDTAGTKLAKVRDWIRTR